MYDTKVAYVTAFFCERRSGFNTWYGSPKIKLDKNSSRYHKIMSLSQQDNSLPSDWLDKFNEVAFGHFSSEKEKDNRERLRSEVISCLSNGTELFKLTTASLWRNYKTRYEVYIPIPNSKKFHTENPDFFIKNGGLLDGQKLVSTKENRTFTLEFLLSGEKMEMFINQDNGKAIQSLSSQFIFGEWVLKNVFQLKDRELLTQDKVEDLGINAMTFTKYDDNRPISMNFSFVNLENPPRNLWE